MTALSTGAACKACQAPLSAVNSLGSKNGFELRPCVQCGSVTVDPFPTIEQLIEFYQSYKGTVNYRAKEKKKIRRARRRIQRLMKRAKGRRFLDVGCNYGFTVKAALDLGLDAKGIDIDAVAVEQSARNFGEGKFEAISIEEYARNGGSADIVYSSEVIEHVHDPDGFVKALADVLVDEGIAYLTTPQAGHWRVPRNFTQWDQVMPPEHITYFSREGLTRLLARHGLRVEKFSFTLKPNIRVIARRIKRGEKAA